MSQHVLESLMANMSGKRFAGAKLPVVLAHDEIYERFRKHSSRGTQRRYANTMQHYALGVSNHIHNFSTNHIPTLEEMLRTRRLSGGVTPVYHLIEYAHRIQLPEEIFEDSTIQELEILGADFVIM